MQSPSVNGVEISADPAQLVLVLHPRTIPPPELSLLKEFGLISLLPPPPEDPPFPLLVLLLQLPETNPFVAPAKHVEKEERHCALQSVVAVQDVIGA